MNGVVCGEGLQRWTQTFANLAPDGLRPDRNAGLILILPLQLAGAWHGGIRVGKSGFVETLIEFSRLR